MSMSIKTVTGDQTVHYIPPRKRRQASGGGIMQLQMTPMIDVTFQLLLFFLLTSTFRQAEGQIPGTLPAAEAAQSETIEKEIRIKVLPHGPYGNLPMFELTGEDAPILSAQKLHDALAARLKYVSDASPVVIEPAANVRWLFVVEAYNQAVRARFKNVGFMPAQ